METHPSLPHLTSSPQTQPDSCLSLSTKLLSHIESTVPSSNPILLSIGCGSGLLEALLQQHRPDIRVAGVEVAGAVNKYLRPDFLYVVKGTWEFYPNADEAAVWLFVYPRDPRLLEKYLDSIDSSDERSGSVEVEGAEKGPHRVIWAGPRVDWEDYKVCFERRAGLVKQLSILMGPEAGLVEWEMIAVFAVEGDAKEKTP